jgi:hypothetical protein
MTSLRARLVLVVALAASFGLAGCMEFSQVSEGQKQGRYQGKPDTNPWDGDPAATGARSGAWTKGDRLSWENHMRARNSGQNEYQRIGQ